MGKGEIVVNRPPSLSKNQGIADSRPLSWSDHTEDMASIGCSLPAPTSAYTGCAVGSNCS